MSTRIIRSERFEHEGAAESNANANLAAAMAAAYAKAGGRRAGDPGCYKRHCKFKCNKR